MISVTFLNVQQGDSILLEWVKSGISKVGIIDCNKLELGNPVLGHILNKKYSQVEFLILSHPHFDHYSGMNELIYTCESNNIKIKHILHSCAQVRDYIDCARSLIEQSLERELIQLFLNMKRINALNNGTGISAIFADSMFNSVQIETDSGDFIIEFLAPRNIDLDRFIRSETYPWDEEEGANGYPRSNWLSTMIKIHNKGSWFLLLCSDVNCTVFNELQNSNSFDGEVILTQCSHHGSKRSLSKQFYNTIKNKKGAPVIFSVGSNPYGHPHPTVVNYYLEKGFDLYATNLEGALNSAADKEVEDLLNAFSVKLPYVSNSKYSGDQKFNIDINGVVS